MAQTIEEALKQAEDSLMELPNVVGVGIGEKGGQRVIKVFVSRKVPESALQPQEIVPKQVEGYETDVEETGFISAQT